MTAIAADAIPADDRQKFVTRLAAAQKGRDRGYSQARHWKLDALDPSVISLVGGGSQDQFRAKALVAQLHALLHSGSGQTFYGRRNASIGTALKGVGRNEDTDRIYSRMTTADTWEQMHEVLINAAKIIRSKSGGKLKPWMVPDWSRLLLDLMRWSGSERDAVRLEWATGFLSYEKHGGDDFPAQESVPADASGTKKVSAKNPKNQVDGSNEPVSREPEKIDFAVGDDGQTSLFP